MLFCFFAFAGPGYAATKSSRTASAGCVTLLEQVNKQLAEQQGVYGVYFFDVRSGEWFGINHLESFYAASTFKLPLNLCLYEKIAKGEINPESNLTYRSEYREGGTGVLQYKPIGSKYTIAELSRCSIVYSDNVATNILLGHLGKAQVKNYMRHLGGQVVDDLQNITCPQDMANFMKCLLRFGATYPEHARTLLHHFENTIYNDRISQPLPAQVKVAHKIGNWPATETYNDVAYVEHSRNPYILAVFSKQTGGSGQAFKVIRSVSKVVYDFQDKLTQIKVICNGQIISSISTQLQSGVVWVPIDAIADVLGAEVSFDGTVKETTVSRAYQVVCIKANGNMVVKTDGQDVSLPVRAKTISGKANVPLLPFCEAFGARGRYDARARLVSLELEVPIELPENVPEQQPLGQVPENTPDQQPLDRVPENVPEQQPLERMPENAAQANKVSADVPKYWRNVWDFPCYN